MCNKAGDNAVFHGDNIMTDSENQYGWKSSFEGVSFSKGIMLLMRGAFLPEWSVLLLGLDLQHTGVWWTLKAYIKYLLECFQRESLMHLRYA